jgi:hypothetical protein
MTNPTRPSALLQTKGLPGRPQHRSEPHGVGEPKSRQHTVCEVRELPSMAALSAWADAHRVRVRYLGPTLEGEPVWGATRGAVTRVAREHRPDPHPHPLVWKSPLEHLETSDE